MELNRVFRIAQLRWKVLIGFAVAGLLVAGFTVARRNAQVEPVWTGTAAWTYERDPLDTTGQQLSVRLLSAQDRAFDATEEIRSQLPGASILANEDLGQLEFRVMAPTETAAREQARNFRDTFEQSELNQAAEGFSAELEEIVSLITDLELQVAELATLTPQEVENQQEIVNLRSQIDDLTRQANSLRVELVTPDPDGRSAEVIEAELEVVESRIGQLKLELAAEPRPDPVQEVRDQVRQNALQRQIEGLEARYIEVYLQQAGFSDTGLPGPVTATDETPAEFSVFGSGILGLLLGGFLGLGAVLAADRVRPLIWTGSDVQSLTVLGAVPDKRPGAGRSVWYLDASPDARKASVQRLRASIEGRIQAGSVSVAIGTFGLAADQTASLVADVAASFTVVGRTALLLDLGGAAGTTVYEFDASPVNIRDVIESPNPIEVVSREAQIGEGLFSVGSAAEALDADSVASPSFRGGIERLVQTTDVTFMTPGDGGAALSQAVYQLANHVVFAVRVGSASIIEIESFAADLRERGVSVLGVVLVGGSVSAKRPIAQVSSVAQQKTLRTLPPSAATGRQATAKSQLQALVHELHAVRDELARGEIADRPEAAGLDSRVAVAVPAQGASRQSTAETDTSAGFVDEFVAALRPYPADRVSGYVEAFLEDRIVGQLTSIQAGSTVRPRPYAFINEWADDESMAMLLRGNLAGEFGSDQTEFLLSEFERVLSQAEIASSTEDWIRSRFFRRHIATTGGEPRIWHLKSRVGYVELLVDWQRLNRDLIDDLRLRLNQMLFRGMDGIVEPDMAVAAAEDVRDFETAFAWLYEGTTPEARIWYPWLKPDEQPLGWDPDVKHGVKAHLAPVQRLGLLSVEVLKLNDLVAFSRSA
jgi:hypothetical protein